MKATLSLCLGAGLILQTGCTSIASRWNGHRGAVYPGVRLDMEHVKHYTSEGELVALVDLPLSALLDTFFLPWDTERPEQFKAKEQPGPVRVIRGTHNEVIINNLF